ncbi:type II toxin-antitoxin system death-on-curing family toxin [Cypionkella sp.]|uniref:type II toxin-antitoxin system death-on-curing family toxin n=1 Tax=Cypionkella sp. TaxID=2811411 RepID=UPI00261E1763|nr:type II toxin-antitoxin system death-on-curing family toxin [Cypionkella sp.]
MTLADAFTAHDEALSYGGREGVTSLHLIQSALARPYSGYHSPIAKKVAALLHSVVANHGFVDGNKRTAWLLAELLVERSGYRLNIPDDEPIDDLVVGVASGDVDFDALVQWFRERLVRI